MATAPSLTRTDKAIGIITRAECIPLDDGRWKVRDTATGSGRWHTTTATSCDCYDTHRGNACKHVCAVRQEAQALTVYAAGWDAWAVAQRPTCPDCGAGLVSTVYWIGGKGYTAFLVCAEHVEHRALPA